MVVHLRVPIEQPPNERDQGDALEIGAALPVGCILLIAKQSLEPMGIPERLGGQRRHDLAETYVALGERLRFTVGTQENCADDRGLPLNRHDDDRTNISRVESGLDALKRRIARRVGNENGLARIERAFQLRVPIEVDDKVADRRILIAGDEADLVVFSGQKDRASIEPERVAELSCDRLQDIDEVQGRRDFLQNVDDRDEVVPLPLQLGDASAQTSDLVIPAGLLLRRRRGRWFRRRLLVALIHRPPQGAR